MYFCLKDTDIIIWDVVNESGMFRYKNLCKNYDSIVQIYDVQYKM